MQKLIEKNPNKIPMRLLAGISESALYFVGVVSLFLLIFVHKLLSHCVASLAGAGFIGEKCE